MTHTGEHTPGPWKIDPERDMNIRGADGFPVAMTNEKDEQLIAAAPEMWELLKQIADDGRVWSTGARELLARIEGQR